MKELKDEKGAIALVTLITMLFIIAFLTATYIVISNKAQTEAGITAKIKDKYNNIEEAEDIYNNYLGKRVINIYTAEQLLKIGTGAQIIIDGKIYTLSDDKEYVLMNDIEFNAVEYEEILGENTNWEAIEDKDYIFEWNGNTITEIRLDGTTVIHKDPNKYTREIKIRVGDYVKYTPSSGTYSVTTAMSGNSNQNFSTKMDLQWRILSINETTGQVEIISETTTGDTLSLKGANGYNHGVDILNDYCYYLYSNSSIGAIARSINADDINAKTTYDYTTNGTYGLSKYSISSGSYPTLYSAEKANSIPENVGIRNPDGTADYTTYTSEEKLSDESPISTDYEYNINNYLRTDLGVNNATEDLLKIGTNYFLASRSIHTAWNITNFAGFRIRYVNAAGILTGEFCRNTTKVDQVLSYKIRPIILLPIDTIFECDYENSTRNKLYWDIQ